MSRGIRVTIDEVFDRMKHKKNQYDHSWEEVLQAGIYSLDAGSSSWWPGLTARTPRPRRQETRDGPAAEYHSPERESEERPVDRGSERDIARLNASEDATLVFDFLTVGAVTIPDVLLEEDEEVA